MLKKSSLQGKNRLLGMAQAAVLVASALLISQAGLAFAASAVDTAPDLDQPQVLGVSTVDLRLTTTAKTNFPGGFNATPSSTLTNGNYSYTFSWGRAYPTRSGYIYVSQKHSDGNYYIVAKFMNLTGTGTVTSDAVFAPSTEYRLSYYSKPYGTFTTDYVILRTLFTTPAAPSTSATGSNTGSNTGTSQPDAASLKVPALAKFSSGESCRVVGSQVVKIYPTQTILHIVRYVVSSPNQLDNSSFQNSINYYAEGSNDGTAAGHPMSGDLVVNSSGGFQVQYKNEGGASGPFTTAVYVRGGEVVSCPSVSFQAEPANLPTAANNPFINPDPAILVGGLSDMVTILAADAHPCLANSSNNFCLPSFKLDPTAAPFSISASNLSNYLVVKNQRNACADIDPFLNNGNKISVDANGRPASLGSATGNYHNIVATPLQSDVFYALSGCPKPDAIADWINGVNGIPGISSGGLGSTPAYDPSTRHQIGGSTGITTSVCFGGYGMLFDDNEGPEGVLRCDPNSADGDFTVAPSSIVLQSTNLSGTLTAVGMKGIEQGVFKFPKPVPCKQNPQFGNTGIYYICDYSVWTDTDFAKFYKSLPTTAPLPGMIMVDPAHLKQYAGNNSNYDPINQLDIVNTDVSGKLSAADKATWTCGAGFGATTSTPPTTDLCEKGMVLDTGYGLQQSIYPSVWKWRCVPPPVASGQVPYHSNNQTFTCANVWPSLTAKGWPNYMPTNVSVATPFIETYYYFGQSLGVPQNFLSNVRK